MNRPGQVAGRSTRPMSPGHQLARTEPDNSYAQDRIGCRIDDELRESIGATQCLRTPTGGPGCCTTSTVRPAAFA